MPICSILTTYTALPPCALSESAGFVNPGDVRANIFVFLQIPYWSLKQCSSCWRTFSGSPKNLSNLTASCLCWRHPETECFCRDTCLLSREWFYVKVMRIMMKTDYFHQNPFCITSFITETCQYTLPLHAMYVTS
jgi:hypothetical protein